MISLVERITVQVAKVQRILKKEVTDSVELRWILKTLKQEEQEGFNRFDSLAKYSD